MSRGEPRSAAVSRGQPRSAAVSRGQPRSAAVSRGLPRSAAVSQGQLMVLVPVQVPVPVPLPVLGTLEGPVYSCTGDRSVGTVASVQNRSETGFPTPSTYKQKIL